jgi:hypothetical protein
MPNPPIGIWTLGFPWSFVLGHWEFPKGGPWSFRTRGKAPPTTDTRPDSFGGPLRPTPPRPDRPRPPASAINHEPSTINRLECQRTTDTVLHFGRTSYRPPVPRSRARIGDLSRAVRRSGIDLFRFRLSTINHQPSTKNQLKLLSMRPASHKNAAPIYVTLHGLHDSRGNKNHPKSSPAINQERSTINRLSWSAPAERQRRRRFAHHQREEPLPYACARHVPGTHP